MTDPCKPDIFAATYESAALPSPANTGEGWISVDDRLPTTTHHVLACNALGYVGRAQWDGRRWNHIGKATHWMPLPSAPSNQGAQHGE